MFIVFQFFQRLEIPKAHIYLYWNHIALRYIIPYVITYLTVIFGTGYYKSSEDISMEKDDSKASVFVEQAESFSSFALKINSENMEQNLENARKVCIIVS